MHVFELNLIRFKSWDQFINSQTDDELMCLNQSKEWKRWNRWWERWERWERWENRLLASEKKQKEWNRVCEGESEGGDPRSCDRKWKSCNSCEAECVRCVCVWQPETDQVWGEEDGVTSDLMERAQNQRRWSELEEEIYTSEESRCEFKQQINTFRLTHTQADAHTHSHTNVYLFMSEFSTNSS